MISDGKLHMFIEDPDAFPPALVEMAKELLAHRKAWSEPVGYVSQIYMNDWAAGGTIHKKPLVNGIPLYRKPSSK
ncbi:MULTISPECIES: hypothetical protein [Pantoea]|uniref:hypothetical protein n=1 Tax=Pantoea TaxID=53335 RepID=UPI000661159A|nr:MULTISPECIES: hypothetical protein [Pantoea]DAL13965.1 MAG TPA_asm: hypothetical protein [Caudoviricetes sp.]